MRWSGHLRYAWQLGEPVMALSLRWNSGHPCSRPEFPMLMETFLCHPGPHACFNTHSGRTVAIILLMRFLSFGSWIYASNAYDFLLPCPTGQHTGRSFFWRRAKRPLSSADSASRVLCLDRRMGSMAFLWRRFWMVYFQRQAAASSSTILSWARRGP